MFATRNLSEAVAAGESPATGRTFMDHRRSIYQPAARHKLICGWTLFAFEAMQFFTRLFACIMRRDKGGSVALKCVDERSSFPERSCQSAYLISGRQVRRLTVTFGAIRQGPHLEALLRYGPRD